MRLSLWALLSVSMLSFGCRAPSQPVDPGQSLSPASRAALEKGVRAFVLGVADGVTQEGPAAWRRYFVDGPSFFMAVDGRLVFPSGHAALEAIQELTRTLQHIELRWKDDLRVDVLTADLAMVASTYEESRVDTNGHRVAETGFFTGLAEQNKGRWQFRNAHWSVLGTPLAPP